MSEAGDTSAESSRIRALQSDVHQLRAQLLAQKAHGERLTATLRDAREQLVALKAEVDRLSAPPSGFGTFVRGHEDGSADILTQGRKMRVAVSPQVQL